MRVGLFTSAFLIAAVALACGTQSARSAFGTEEASPEDGPSTNFGEKSCSGLECWVAACGDGTTTTLRGKVFDPAGVHPLYNVMVYIPGGEDPETLPPITDSTKEPSGISCETCASTVIHPLRSALTDGTGSFVLEDVPFKEQLPVVIQVGKWRRLLHVDVTNRCAENIVSRGVLRLPKNGAEGDMPQIAVTTGGADSLECLLRGIGIDDKEFVDGNKSTGHIHLYKGEGGGLGTPAKDFWNDATKLRKYDMVLLSCEGDEYQSNKGGSAADARGSMHEYLNAGGKVFASHYHYTWFKHSPAPEFRDLVNWDATAGSSANAYEINRSFPKGKMLAKWLDEVGASKVEGEIELTNLREFGPVKAPAVPWISSDVGDSVYLTVNTPIASADSTPFEAERQCGRAVLTGLHVTEQAGPTAIAACSVGSGKLTPQQSALEFLFFDLSACVMSDDVAPSAPK